MILLLLQLACDDAARDTGVGPGDSGDADTADSGDTDSGDTDSGDTGETDTGDSGDSGDTDTDCTEVDGFADADGDGYGDPATPQTGCDAVGDATDCDDGDDAVHPGATEVCGDGVDQDCAATAACRLTGGHDADDATARLPAVHNGWAYGGDLDGDGQGDFAGLTPAYDLGVWFGPFAGDETATTPDLSRTVGAVYAASFAFASGGAGEPRVAWLRSDSATSGAMYLYDSLRLDVEVGLVTGDFGQAYTYPQRFTNVGDTDGDGVDELALPSTNTGRVYLVPASLDHTITTAEAAATILGTSWTVHALGDIDGDGHADVGTSDNGDDAWVHFGPLAGERSVDTANVAVRDSGGLYTGHGMAWCADAGQLVVSNLVSYDVGLFSGVVDGAVLDGSEPTLTVVNDKGGDGAYVYDVHCRDFDADGTEDLAIGAYNYAVEVFWGLPTADVRTLTGDLSLAVTYGTPLRSADADGDGAWELAVGEYEASRSTPVYDLRAE